MENITGTDINTDITTPDATGEPTPTPEDIEVDVDTLTPDEVEKAVQSATDKVRTEYTKKLKALEGELEQYKPSTKTDAEIALEQRIADLEAKEQAIADKEKLLTINEMLTKQGLPKQLSKYLVGAEDVTTEVASLKEIFNSNMLNNSFKPQDHKSKGQSMTKQEFKKLGYLEREKLAEANPELYNAFK